jgi:FtsP/CotA-like multicopper oxidase with cupredoxin domain
MNLLRFQLDRAALRARKNRQELIAAGLNRRDLFRMGLLTGGGFLVTQQGLSAWASGSTATLSSCGLGLSPKVTPFVEPLPIMPVLPARPASAFTPAPTIAANRTINPATGLPFEGRTESHQFRARFPVQQQFITRMGANPKVSVHPDLPAQTFWGFNLGGTNFAADPPLSPGPTIVTRYLAPILVRRYNQLPPQAQNGGFGVPEVSTHLHNFHSGPDSDGGPCDPVQARFFRRGQFYDYNYTMQYAGFDSTHPPHGNVEEALSTLWYHDHRVDHTSENVYKGLAGFYLAFNEFDSGNENTGLRLPSFPAFDIPLLLADKLFDPDTGLLCFDTFGLDGLVGDTQLTNGKVQPFLEVRKRRYRFRVLDAGPSRTYRLFLTNPGNPSQSIPLWQITSDGNLLPRPIETKSFLLGVAERADVIIDFKKIAERFGNPSRIWLENRLEMVNGRKPTGKIFPAGQGTPVLEFRLLGGNVVDNSFDPEPVASPRVPASVTDNVFAPIALPSLAGVTPRLTRTFRFERGNGQWQINGQLMDCTKFRFRVQRNTTERWILQNSSGGWEHPIHIHLEEFRIIRRNGRLVRPGDADFGRQDVVQLGDEDIEILIRFRDFRGGYPIHCHNTVHEDHQMMLLFEVADVGDNKTKP